MSHTALLPRLRAMGARLSIVGDNLRVTAPQDLFTDNLLKELRANKNSIIQALLDYYKNKVKTANSLSGLTKVLKDFSQHRWHLLQQRDMSNAYTPKALLFIDKENQDKWSALERLEFLCWGKHHETI